MDRSTNYSKYNNENSKKALGDLLTVKETAKYLRVSTSTINRLIHNHEIGYLKIGGRILIPTKSINAFLEKHYVAPIDAEIIARRILERNIKF